MSQLHSTGDSPAKTPPSTAEFSRKFRPRLRTRTMSVENTSLTEVITIYEKLKKSKDNAMGGVGNEPDVFRPSICTFDFTELDESDVEETAPLEPFRFGGYGAAETINTQKVLNFSKYKGIKSSKYLYFSANTGLLQSENFQDLCYRDSTSSDLNYVKLLKSKKYWFNIIDPTEEDLALLASAFSIHDLTLRDIREGNTEEKIEVYKHYTFMSLRLLTSEIDNSSQKSGNRRSYCQKVSEGENLVNITNGSDDTVFLNVEDYKAVDNISIPSAAEETTDKIIMAEDVDFNVLLFSDFIITIHDKNWSSIKDVLGFLNLLVTYGNSPLSPDWVLFSIFIELAQDAKYSVNLIEPKILNMKENFTSNTTYRGGGSELFKFQKVLRTNFQYELELYKISRFVKPKMNILKMLMFKCNKRLSSTVCRLLSNISSEFSELQEELGHFSHILERSQDTYLTLANVQQSHEANEMSKVMKRISEIALIFLPVQAIAGFMGMNVQVPFQIVDGTLPFWATVGLSFVIALVIFTLRKFVLDRHFRAKIFGRRN